MKIRQRKYIGIFTKLELNHFFLILGPFWGRRSVGDKIILSFFTNYDEEFKMAEERSDFFSFFL